MKNSNAAPPRGTCFKDTLLRIEEKKAQYLAVFKPTISRVLLHRPALYRWATTAANSKDTWNQAVEVEKNDWRVEYSRASLVPKLPDSLCDLHWPGHETLDFDLG